MATHETYERALVTHPPEGAFRFIPGIGPGIEQRLHDAGIRTFAQLARMTPEDIRAALGGMVGMTAERIAAQDWPGKAQTFARPPEQAAEEQPPGQNQPSPLAGDEPGERQHYASFLVELLLEDDGSARRTRMVHVQADRRDSWAGWNPGRVTRWIMEQSGMAAAPELERALQDDTPPVEPQVAPQPEEAPGRPLPVVVFDLSAVETRALHQPAERPWSDRFFFANQPFDIRLTLQVHETQLAAGESLACHGAVDARALGSGERIALGEVTDTRDSAAQIELAFACPGLPEGTYRLEAAAVVGLAGAADPEKAGLRALHDGGLLHIFSE
jgi:hypothetical protein